MADEYANREKLQHALLCIALHTLSTAAFLFALFQRVPPVKTIAIFWFIAGPVYGRMYAEAIKWLVVLFDWCFDTSLKTELNGKDSLMVIGSLWFLSPVVLPLFVLANIFGILYAVLYS